MDYHRIKPKENIDVLATIVKKLSFENITPVFLGLTASIGATIWWNNELRSFLGDKIATSSFICLLKVGTGDCANFWYAGMHQTNQIASLIFYCGILVLICKTTKRDKALLLCLALFIRLYDLAVSPDNQTQMKPYAQQEQYHSNRSELELAKQAGDDAKAAIAECKNKRVSGELKTYAESALCSNPKIIEAYQNVRYRHMDLITSFTWKRLELAEKIDSHNVTETEAQIQASEFLNNLINTEHQRNSGR